MPLNAAPPGAASGTPCTCPPVTVTIGPAGAWAIDAVGTIAGSPAARMPQLNKVATRREAPAILGLCAIISLSCGVASCHYVVGIETVGPVADKIVNKRDDNQARPGAKTRIIAG